MEQILLAYGIPKETVAAITIIYRNTKVKVRSPDGDTDYFDIVAGVLQGYTLAPYLITICLDSMLRTSIDKMTATTQECCEQFWTSPGGNTPQSPNWTATYLPLRKLSKLDEPHMQNIAGAARTSS